MYMHIGVHVRAIQPLEGKSQEREQGGREHKCRWKESVLTVYGVLFLLLFVLFCLALPDKRVQLYAVEIARAFLKSD